MTSIQKENGHIDIAHGIAEALCKTNLSAYESRILWCVFRKTYGWHKKEANISLNSFTEETEMNKTHICRTIKKLTDKNILKQSNNKYPFNKYCETWKRLPKQVIKTGLPKQVIKLPKQVIRLPKQVTNITYIGNKKTSNASDSNEIQASKEKKETIIKETIQKKGDFNEISNFFYGLYPKHEGKKNAIKSWLKINPNEELQKKIILALKNQCEKKWKGTDKKYIPLPASWLNGERWEDEIPEEEEIVLNF